MAEQLTTAPAIAAYRQRSHIAETPHGHIKRNMGIGQISPRGKPPPPPNAGCLDSSRTTSAIPLSSITVGLL
jgi:hypothetical protein